MITLGNTVRHRRSRQLMRIDRLFGDFATCTWDHSGKQRRRIYRRDELEAVPVVQHPTLGVTELAIGIKS